MGVSSLTAVFAVVCHIATAAYVDYKGDTVLRVNVNSEDQLKKITTLDQQYDIWHEARHVGDHADVHVPKAKVKEFHAWLQSGDYDFRVMVADVGRLIHDQREEIARRPRDPKALDRYRTLSEVEEYMFETAAAFPDLVEVTQIAESYEGRPIYVMKISTGGADKPVFWADSGIHSREWVAPATTLYYIDQLVNGYGEDAEITEMLNSYDFYILPVFNVDGYEYTWSDDRLWRKTRSPNSGSACVGTDPNRNWDFMWNTVNAGGPCTQTFPGDAAFSEVEVRGVAAFMGNLDIKVVLAIHAYGQMYLMPWGYTSEPNPDFDEQKQLCDDANLALRAVHGQVYRCDSLQPLVGPNSGGSIDYTYGALEIKYSYGVELRDTGTYGFILPENQIIPTAEENWAALKVFALRALDG
jgi:murein tripeptide amidase MpaA